MATKAEVRDMAARKVGVLGIGQTLSAEYTSAIDAAFDATFHQLRKKGLNTWAYSAEVPTEIEDFYSAVVAGKCALDLGASSEKITLLSAAAQAAFREMQLYLTPAYAATDDPEDF